MTDQRFRILLYHAGGTKSWLYPAVLHLKTYIDITYPEVANRLEWLVPIQQTLTDKELLAYVDQHQPDVLCTSHYMWNHEYLIAQLDQVKSQLSDHIKVIAGGPSINVNLDPDFFNKHPYIDYAVYGAGEHAFADIIKSLVDQTPMVAFNTSNCGWINPNTGQPIVAEYKFVKMISTSPFTHNKELFAAMTQTLLDRNGTLYLPYTLTRGCPYSCTFCDWNSGLGNKISRRKNTYQEEIDLFHELGIKQIYLSDANVGQYDEDVDMIEYFAQKNLQHNAGFKISGNYSKLRKDVNLKIFNIMATSGLVQKTLNFSIQDTNEEILKNIDRPDVGWDVHAAMADQLVANHPQLIVKAQLIYGLPGQTPVTWRETLSQITQKNILPIVFLNEPLPASPAMYDPTYQQKFRFEYVKSTRIDPGFDFYTSEIPRKCISFDQRDLVEMTLLSGVYNALSVIKFILLRQTGLCLDIEPIVDVFVASLHYQTLCDNLYANWTTEQKFYFTKDFIGNPAVLTCEPMAFGGYLASNNNFIVYIAKLLPQDTSKKLMQLALRPDFKDSARDLCSEID
jgi:tRNA A37 methylthiotransferase MiaB